MNCIDIGNRLELFVDNYIVEKHNGTILNLPHPVRSEKVLHFNSPWDGALSAYVTVFKDKDIYRMYYRGMPLGIKVTSDSSYAQYFANVSLKNKALELTCYAESYDGIIWTKPNLGLFEFEGNKNNNIVWIGTESTNFVPFIDLNPAAKQEEKYKAVGGGNKGLVPFISTDGIHWKKKQPDPVLTKGAFDSQNIVVWDTVRSCYGAYYRQNVNGLRIIVTSTSKDFINWTGPVELNYGPNTPKEQFYTNAIIPYYRAPHILVGFPKRFCPNRRLVKEHNTDGISDGVLITSRDGTNFDRTFIEAFLRPGRDILNWTDRNNMISWGILNLNHDELSIYYSQHYRHNTSHLRRGVLRLDGFVSVSAGWQSAEFVTKPLSFSGKNLVLNYATSAVGYIKVEIQDSEGKPINGYSIDNCPEIYGDEIEHKVIWTSGINDLSLLTKKPIKLRFVMKDADLYSLQFV